MNGNVAGMRKKPGQRKRVVSALGDCCYDSQWSLVRDEEDSTYMSLV